VSMHIVVTGANGFIGRNLVAQLADRGHKPTPITRDTDTADLNAVLRTADAVCHLAGVNRPDDEREFDTGNAELSRDLCARLIQLGRSARILFASSMHVERNNAYGRSKRAAEMAFEDYHACTGAPVHLFRLPHVIGKWCRPNYNSVVATFCHNIARNLPIAIDTPESPLKLVYIDDLVDVFEGIITGRLQAGTFVDVEPAYPTTVGELAGILTGFRDGRHTLTTERVGTGMLRALYATYLSYLPIDDAVYPLTRHADPRGVFVEMLKTKDSGQFSYFTARPGITRGGHYHHTKSEKFLVLKGTALFRFRNILTGDRHEVRTTGSEPCVVEMLPGWTHDITNIGEDDMIVMLWANEVFDRARPDTFVAPL
jgi:UDP-2-acetamido-2,6-beta-L-arabino-hexul-4-ose reductase